MPSVPSIDSFQSCSSNTPAAVRQLQAPPVMEECNFATWRRTLILTRKLTPVFAGEKWIARDILSRTPWAILKFLISQGAKIQDDVVMPLDELYLPGEALNAKALHKLFWDETTGKGSKFGPLGAGLGGNLPRSSRDDGLLSHDITQLKGPGDGGLWKHLTSKLARIEASALQIAERRRRNDIRPEDFISLEDRIFAFRMRELKKYFELVEGRLYVEHDAEDVIWHNVSYLRKNAVSLHPDRRLDSPLTVRAIFPLWTSKGRRGQPAPVSNHLTHHPTELRGRKTLISAQAQAAAAHVLGAAEGARDPVLSQAAEREERALRPRGRGALRRVRRRGALHRARRRRLLAHPARGRRGRLVAVALALVGVGRAAGGRGRRRPLGDPGLARRYCDQAGRARGSPPGARPRGPPWARRRRRRRLPARVRPREEAEEVSLLFVLNK